MARVNKLEHYVTPNLVTKAPPRLPLDVGQWRMALMSADKDRIKPLYNLYEDILLDGVLADAIEKRIDAIALTPMTFVDSEGQEVEAVTDLMDSLDWEEMLRLIMRTIFFGRTAFEVSITDGAFTCKEIPPKHINLKDKKILIKEDDRDGVNYQGRLGLVVLGKRRDFGLLLKAAPFAIYKRGGFGDWAQWIELFGMPQRIGKYNINDPESRKHLEEALSQAGSASYIIAPDGTEIENAETGTSNGTSFNDFRKACNEEMLITILGQTMTTVQGDKGARSLGEVHQEVEATKHKRDLRYTERVLNHFIKPILEAYGYPVTGGRFSYPREAQALEVSDIIQLSDIIDIPKRYLHEHFAIPMAEKGEAIARRTAMPMEIDPYIDEDEGDSDRGNKGDKGDKGDDTDKKPKEEKGLEHSDESWLGRVLRFFSIAPSGRLGAPSVTPRPTWTTAQINLADADVISQRVTSRVAEREGRDLFDGDLFLWTASDLIKAVRKALERHSYSDIPLETSYQIQQDAFVTAMEMNLFRFSAGKTLSQVQALNDAFRKSKSYSDFRERAREITSTYNERWQKTEYNTALLTAESAANYRDLMRKKRLFPYWKYVTAGDSAVRPEHAELEGVVLPCSDKKWEEIFPPNGWGCRCSVRALMAHEVEGVDEEMMRQRVIGYQNTSDWQNAKAQGWAVNRAKEATIFDSNQQYLYKLPRHGARSIDELTPEHYGLESVSKIMKKKSALAPETEWQESEVWQRTAGDSDVMMLEDYAKRQIVLTKQVFDANTQGDKGGIQQWDAAMQTLRSPDEVWVHRTPGKGGKRSVGREMMTLIRYYYDKVIVVGVHLSLDKLELTRWGELEMKKNAIKRQRRGLLVSREPQQEES